MYKKKVAVIIATYGTPNFLLECLESVRSATVPDGYTLDIRIGVDGCAKSSRLLSRNKISHFISLKNVGSYVMRNSLAYIRAAEYYSYFDSDDVMKKNYFIEVCSSLDSGAEFVIGAKIQCSTDMKPLEEKPVCEYGGAFTFSQNVLNSLGGFHHFRCACDSDFMERARMAGYKVETIKDAIYYRRRHSRSITKSKDTRYRSKYRLEAWQAMSDLRKQNIIKVEPVKTSLKQKKYK